MKRFISLPNKILFFLLVLLLTLAASMSWLWVNKTQDNFEIRTEEINERSKIQYRLLNQRFAENLEAWVGLLEELHQTQSDPLKALAETLKQRQDFLLLKWQVEDLWLIDGAGNSVYASAGVTPGIVADMQKQVLNDFQSVFTVHCEQQCRQLLSIPIRAGVGDPGALTMSIGLLDMLALLNQSTKSDVALVYVPTARDKTLARDIVLRSPMATEQRELFRSYLVRLPETLTVEKLLESGIHIHIQDKHLLLTLVQLTDQITQQNFILMAHDISREASALEEYKEVIIATGTMVFFLAGVFIYLLSYSFKKKLNQLTFSLPLLAKREYQQFRQQSSGRRSLLNDELDQLQTSAVELANRLEALDEEVEFKTSELEQMAMYDSLTNLPNRNMFKYQLNQSILELRRARSTLYVMLFDLDDFKKVNDSYGHTVGDTLLVSAAKRLKEVLRQSDLACRFGGDEFALLLKNIDDYAYIIKVAQKILASFQQPIEVEDLEFYVSTSIGISSANSHEANVDEIIRQADIAMYKAKEAGGNCYRNFDDKMSKDAMEKVDLESQARTALIENQFSYALQPQIELTTNRLVGFEALLRWRHPKRGIVSPGLFIPVLENTEFMLSLGYWCIEHACKTLVKFREQGYRHLKVAINLAAIQFLDPRLIPILTENLDKHGLPAGLIELELTERTLVSDIEKATQIMQRLIDLGFYISIDDFGTGYSSLSYLKRMPAHIIKIDRSFVDGMLSSSADRQIVASTINMVQNLGMKVVAEGIEVQEQLVMLKELHCDMAQGYLMAKPIPEESVIQALQDKCQNGIWNWKKA